MRPYNLNAEEIAHIEALRTLTTNQHRLVYYLTRSYAQSRPQGRNLPQNVIPLRVANLSK